MGRRYQEEAPEVAANVSARGADDVDMGDGSRSERRQRCRIRRG